MMKRILTAAVLLALAISPAASACWQWSLTAASNATADPTINWAEGMAPSAVNDSARAMMARIAECRDDISGKLATTGTSTAYLVTTNQGTLASTPGDGQQLVVRLNATNGAAPTLAADGGTAFPIQSSPGVAVPTGTMISGVPYRLTFSTANSAWLLQDYYSVTINLDQFGSTRGSILERASGGWTAVVPGGAGQVWTSNGSGADPTYQTPGIVFPQGYLTPTSGTPVITTDATAVTRLYYTPLGGSVPIYNGSNFANTPFNELILDLSAGSQAANGIYDVFVFSSSGTVTAAFGPVWTVGGGSVSSGSGARGTGVGSTELQRINGLWTNKNSIAAANNGATTYAVPANQGTYVGSVLITSVAGQTALHTSYGTSRTWGVWNAYNRKPITLIMGDSTSSWTYASATVRPSRNQTTNKLTVFSGLPEENVDVKFTQVVIGPVSTIANIGIGWNSTTAYSGVMGYINTGAAQTGQSPTASYLGRGLLGIVDVTSLEAAPGATTVTFSGAEVDMRMTATWGG